MGKKIIKKKNGKNVCLEAREYYGLLINGEKILHTAHQVKTSKKAFRRFEAFFTDKKHPEIMAEVKNIRYTNGEECIELINGGRIEYSTRSRQAARGFDGVSLVVYDEAQELTDEQLEATMATLAASATGTRQIIYAGTPPYPGCPGKVFGRIRGSVIEKAGPYDSWHEWSVEGRSIDEIKIDDFDKTGQFGENINNNPDALVIYNSIKDLCDRLDIEINSQTTNN